MRLSQCRLATKLDSTKRGFKRVDTTVVQQVMVALGWKKPNFEYHVSMGRKWNEVCRQFDSLLCFIFLSHQNGFGIKPKSYQDMGPSDLETFRYLLNDEYTKSICKAGKAFQESLEGVVDIEFQWETRPQYFSSLASPPQHDMLSYLQPYQTISENI